LKAIDPAAEAAGRTSLEVLTLETPPPKVRRSGAGLRRRAEAPDAVDRQNRRKC